MSSGGSRLTRPWRNDWMPPGRGGKSLVTRRTFGTSAQLGAKKLPPLAGGTGERNMQLVVARTRESGRCARRRRPDGAVEADQRTLPVALSDEPAGHPRAFVGFRQLLVRSVELAVRRELPRDVPGAHIGHQLLRRE